MAVSGACLFRIASHVPFISINVAYEQMTHTIFYFLMSTSGAYCNLFNASQHLTHLIWLSRISMSCRNVFTMYLLASAPIRMRNVYQMLNANRERERESVYGSKCDSAHAHQFSLSIVEHVLQVNDYDKNLRFLMFETCFLIAKGVCLYGPYFMFVYVYAYLLYTMLLIRRVIIHDIRCEHLECYGVNAFVHIKTFQNRICIYVDMCVCECECVFD